MNFLDIGIFTILFYNIISGLKKGLIRSVFEILALIGGILLAVSYYQWLANLFITICHFSQFYATITSFIVIWCVIFLLVMAIGQFLHQFLTFSILNWINYLGGGVLGFIKGIVVLLPFILPMYYFHFIPVQNSLFLKTTTPMFMYIMDNWVPLELFQMDLTNPVEKIAPKTNPEETLEKEKKLNQLLRKNNLNLESIQKGAFKEMRNEK